MVAANSPQPEGTLLGGSSIAMLASTEDGWYAAVLRDGTTITFQRLEVCGQWVRFVGFPNVYGSILQSTSVIKKCIEVRADDIRVITGSQLPEK